MSLPGEAYVILAIVAFFCCEAPTYAEEYALQHVHKTASLFMDSTEMHPVRLDIRPDGIRLSFAGSFRSAAGSRTLHCNMPSFITPEKILSAEVKSGEQQWRGGGRLSQLELEVIGAQNKREKYIFISGTAVRFQPYDAYRLNGNLQWREGTDGGQSVRSARESISAIVPSNHSTPPSWAQNPSDLNAALRIPSLLRPELAEQSGHSASVDAIVVTQNGKWLISAGHDFSIRLWDFVSHREVRVIGRHSREVNALVACPDNSCVVSGSNDRTIKMWELPRGRLIRSFNGHSNSITSLAMTRDGRWLVSGSGDPPNFEDRKPDYSVRMWDLHTGSEIRRLNGHTGIVASVDVSRDEKTLVTGSFDGTVKIWNLQTGQLLCTIGGFNGEVRASFTPDSSHLLVSSAGKLGIWDARTGELTRSGLGRPRPYQAIMNAAGTTLAYPENGVVDLVDLGTGSQAAFHRTNTQDQRVAESVAFSPDGKYLIGGYSDGAIEVWNINTKAEKDFSGYASPVESVDLSANGRWLASGSRDFSIKVWDCLAGELVATLSSENNVTDALAFSPDSRLLASSGFNYSGSGEVAIEVWDVSSRKKQYRFVHTTRKVEFLMFSPDGRWLASGAAGNAVEIWNLTSGRELLKLSPAFKAIWFSADGSSVTTGSTDGALTQWSLPNGRVLARQPSVGWAYSSSGNRKWVASTGWRNEFKVWDVEKAAEWLKRYGNSTQSLILDPSLSGRVHTFHGHSDFVSDVIFSPNNRIVASCSWDGEIKLWNVENGREIRALKGHTSGIQSIVFSQDGSRIISGGWDGTVRIWDIDQGKEILTLISARRSDDWLVVSPTGLFDGRADAMAEIGWRNPDPPNDIWSLDRYFNDYFYPGLLSEIVAGLHPQPVIDVAAVLRIPGLRIMLRDNPRSLSVQKIGEAVYACFAKEPNAIDTVMADQGHCPYGIRLSVAGSPEEILAFLNRTHEPKPDPWSGTKIGRTDESTLHIVTVGIGKYPSSADLVALPSSASSADQIDKFFENQMHVRNRLFKSIKIWNVPPLRDEVATRDAIRTRLREMSTSMRADDVVLVFLAGHGQVLEDEEAFYFDSADSVGTPKEARRASGLSTAMLADAIRQMPARRMVVIIDSCQSGSAIEPLSGIAETKGILEMRKTNAIMGSSSGSAIGVYVIAATSPVESGGQSTNAANTPLVATLLEALQTKEQDSDGKIWMDDVVRYIQRRFSEFSGKSDPLYSPLIAISGANFPIAVVQ